MKLYHFTAQRFADSVAREGLTRGHLVLWDRPPSLQAGWQWMTSLADWKQSWARGTGMLPYRTNEVRFDVDIPDNDRRLRRWINDGPVLSPAYRLLSAYGDPENWWLYRGTIPAAWLSNRTHNPEYAAAAFDRMIDMAL